MSKVYYDNMCIYNATTDQVLVPNGPTVHITR